MTPAKIVWGLLAALGAVLMYWQASQDQHYREHMQSHESRDESVGRELQAMSEQNIELQKRVDRIVGTVVRLLRTEKAEDEE